MDDVFEVQDEIAKAVVEKLKVKLLGAADEPLVQRPTNNLEAHELCPRWNISCSGPGWKSARGDVNRTKGCRGRCLASTRLHWSGSSS